MRNTNRDYFITLNAKTGAVSTTNNIRFCVTDKNTSNIFCQLIFSETNNSIINSYAPNEHADDYNIILRIIKPNNEPKVTQFQILNASSFVYYVDLDDELKDYIGTYRCECFIESTINGRIERLTSSEFTYTVSKSIMNDLDSIIEGSDFPLVDSLATKEYVDSIAFGDIDVTRFVTDEELEQAIANIDMSGIDLTGYATETYVNDRINTIELTPGPQGPAGEQGPQGIQGPAGRDGVDGLTTAISVNGSTYNHVNGTITLPNYPTIPDSLPANGGNADTVGGYSIWTGTQAEYDAITVKDANTIYIIKEA